MTDEEVINTIIHIIEEEKELARESAGSWQEPYYLTHVNTLEKALAALRERANKS